jgi:E3 ubiquitin-protein ligase XBAT32/33
MRADYLSGRTALHFAAMNGHVRCIRLVVADFVPSAPYEAIRAHSDAADKGGGSNVKGKHEQRYTFPFHYVICNYILLPT